MAQDPEKRFELIMDKLFHSPKSPLVFSSSPEAQASRGKKRPNPSSALALVELKRREDGLDGSHSSPPAETSQAPLCRPWDRGDLMRRLRTFKAMTWFARPKVISPINCARRGWINVDMDIIACESCEARLLFTTPPSWRQQQVEKAASVFSLKLDNGHRLLCPWIDNVCDEALAEFPFTTPADLIHKFKERSSALLELDALPVISSSAIGYLRSPDPEVFFREPLFLQKYNGVAEFTRPEAIGNRSEAESTMLYYQALKLISLCGWETRALPYMIDWKEGSGQFVKDSDLISTSQEASSRQSLSVSISSDATNELQKAFEDTDSSSLLPSNPSSVVLDCKLCGASVGLWTFSVVPQPVELLKFVGCSEINAGNVIGETSNVGNSSSHSTPSSEENFSGLKLTIAGGPPPTKQNFKATISLPVIGRSLWAKFFHDSEYRANVVDKLADIHCSPANDKPSTCTEDAVLKRDDSFTKESHNSLDGTSVNAEGTSDTVVHDSVVEGPVESVQNDFHGSDQDKRHAENVENIESEHVAANGSCIMQVEESPDKLAVCNTGKNLELLFLDGKMQFDPIRQHRQFCPWIASSSNRAPGWKQTLSALLRGKQIPASPQSAPSTSVIKVDDPVASVRRLFMSSSAKRTRSRH